MPTKPECSMNGVHVSVPRVLDDFIGPLEANIGVHRGHMASELHFTYRCLLHIHGALNHCVAFGCGVMDSSHNDPSIGERRATGTEEDVKLQPLPLAHHAWRNEAVRCCCAAKYVASGPA